MKTMWLALILPIVSANVGAQILVKGRVQDESEKPIAFVNVFFKDGDYAGDVTDENGLFEIATKVSGSRRLVASMMGYERCELAVEIPTSHSFRIRLLEKAIDFKEVQIEASAYTGGEGKVTLTKIDVYTTPGGAADVFQSIKALPGITQTDESAALPVRGGNPSEVLILMNQAPVPHPYRAENTGGVGLFSIIETATVKRLYFSSGGFSSKYGNALSGVLDIETDPRITKSRYQLDANFASAGAGVQQVFVDRRLTGHFYVKKTFTDLLFRINEPSVDVVQDPSSISSTAILNYTYSATGLLQLTTVLSNDDQSFRLPIFANETLYSLNSAQRIVGLTWSDVVRRNWIAKASASYSGYRQDLRFDPWKKNNDESVFSARMDNTIELAPETLLLVGGDAAQEQYRFNSNLPFTRGEYYTGSDSADIRENVDYHGGGLYAELQKKLFRRVTGFAGIRADYKSLTQRWTHDLRLGLVRELSKTTFLRLAAGTFHQTPDAWYDRLRDPETRLQSMRANHVVAALEENRGDFQLRAEFYGKWYDHLLSENDNGLYESDGRGLAYGSDIFVKGKLGRSNGWISYSFIRTRRKEFNVPTLRPTIYDVTHSVKFVQKTPLGRGFEAASTLRWASGRPFTPVIGAEEQPQGYWRPLYGDFYGKRMPAFFRLDARLSHFTFFGEGHYLVFYIEALNILNHKNLLDYAYTEDFSQRHDVLSYFAHRTVVFGFSLSY